MVKIFLSLFLVLSVVAKGQDTTYYNSDMDRVSSKDDACYIEVLLRSKEDTNVVYYQEFNATGQKLQDCHYSNYSKHELDGLAIEWYKTGEKKSETKYENRKKKELRTWWKTGMKKREDFYKDDSLVSGKCFNEKGTEIPYFSYEIMPEYYGGMEAIRNFLSREIVYPSKMRRKGIEGRVLVKFVVTKEGKVERVSIVKSVCAELDAEAKRVVEKMPDWKPGYQDGESVNVYYTLPITFRLE
jgi:protein TonB